MTLRKFWGVRDWVRFMFIYNWADRVT
jgi:hypothetical protein